MAVELPVYEVPQSGGAVNDITLSSAMTAAASAASSENTVRICGQEFVVLYGGTGTSGGVDVYFYSPNSYDSGEGQSLTVKCGSTSANNFSIVGGLAPRNWNKAYIGNKAYLAQEAGESMVGAAIKHSVPHNLTVPFSFENITVGAGKLSTTVTGQDNTLVFPNRGSLCLLLTCNTSAGTWRVVGNGSSPDSERSRTETGDFDAIDDFTVLAGLTPSIYGNTISVDMTSSGSTTMEVFAFDAFTGLQVEPS